jgi:hypothetical protein
MDDFIDQEGNPMLVAGRARTLHEPTSASRIKTSHSGTRLTKSGGWKVIQDSSTNVTLNSGLEGSIKKQLPKLTRNKGIFGLNSAHSKS